MRGRKSWRRPVLVAGLALVAVLVSVSAGVFRSDSPPVLVRALGAGRATPGDGAAPLTKPHAVTAHKGAVTPHVLSHPRALHLTKAGSAVFDVRKLKSVVVKRERPENAAPGEVERAGAKDTDSSAGLPATVSPTSIAAANAPAPGPDSSFDGLDFTNWGAGHPPDENGDVGPTYYIQTVNTSIGIYDKSNGNRVAAFTFDAFMSQGSFGNLCDTDNFGDPVVLYDSFENRWFITDFAFKLDGSGNINPQHAFQCFAVSKTGDPVSGGWNFYSIEDPGGLGDYPKFGVWPDGIYMSANMFGYAAGASFISPHVWALNKQQMYAGAPTAQVVDFSAPSADFTLLPANSRLQTGTPPAGTPEYFVSTWQFLNAQSVYKFRVDWDKVSTSTLTGPDTALAPNCWPNASVANASTPANALDTLQIRAMAQAQYTNMGGAESLWVDHTVQRGVSATNTTCNATTGGNATPRWYQINVTGGTVAANDVQGATYDPDGANTFFRFMPALAVDRAGDMAMVYSKSNATTNPQIKYAGRLAGDPANTFSQTEQTLIDGTGSQSGNCGSSTCTRWGDYSGMALDPNGCEFWMTEEYYATNGLADLTRIGSFHYPSCTTVGNGTLQGTVTIGGNPAAGATVTLGSRTTTTDGNGAYSFTVPAGTYPSLTAAKAGFDAASTSSIAVPDGGTATRNLSLTAAAQSGCFTDNTQTAFQRGIPSSCDLVASPGSVVLAKPDNTDAKNGTVSPTGFGISNTSWAGQTFTPTVTGQINRVDVELFCASCTATSPNVTLSIRATTGTTPVPTGADLATATLPGFNDGGVGGLKTFTFASPVTLTAGTRYAFVFRLASSFANGTMAYTCSCATTGFSNTNPYANGQRVTSSNSGSTWTADTTVGGRDLNFVTYVNPGYTSTGTLISSLKDANPAAGSTAQWTTLSFSATTPANTGLKFQVAGSNNQYGPFNYVGPDGTATTFFTSSGASLSQFNGLRYLRYKAILTTTDPSVTPSLSSAQVCFQDVAPAAATTLTVSPASGTFGGTSNLSATLTSGGNPVPNEQVSFTLNGNPAGSGTTDASGVATVNNAGLAGINAGSYATGVGASFAGDSSFAPSSGSAALTVNPADQAISISLHAPPSAVFNTGFSVAATGGNSGNPVTFSSTGACTNSGPSFTMTSGTGTCTVKYDQAGNANYNPAPQVTESVNAQKAAQSITIDTHAPPSAVFNTQFTVAAHGGGSANPVTYSSSGGCSNSGATFTMTSGTTGCTVQYDQAGDSNYSAAPQVTESVNAQKADQTITIETHAPASAVFGSSFGVAASAPGGVVTFSNAGGCSNNGNTFTMTSGTTACTVKYDQGGSADYNAAPQVTESVNAQKADQTISVQTHAPASAPVNGQFTVAATAPGGPVSYSSSGACTNSGPTFTMSSTPGTCTVQYDQGGSGDYNAAPQVTETTTSSKADQTITVQTHAPGSAVFGTQFTVAATAPGGSVTYSSSGGCSNSGATFTMTSGTTACTVRYDQPGDATYNPAPQVTETVNAQKADQAITVDTSAPASAVFNTSFGVAAHAPGGAVSFSSAGACSNNGNTFTMTSGTGTCSVDFDQAGDSNYNPAPQVTQIVDAQKADQTITFGSLPGKTYGDPDFALGATASSGLPVGYSASGNCTTSGGNVHITGAGSCQITASQGGDSNYDAAPSVPQSFSIAQKTLTITANDRTKLVGTTLNLGTTAFSTSGLVGSDGISSVTLSSAGAAAGAATGTYPIVPSNAVAAGTTNLGNYDVHYADGTLTVVAGGLIGTSSVQIGQSNALIDSFDSSLGPYGGSNVGDAASIASNGAVAINGAKVHGSVTSTNSSVTLKQFSLVTGNVTAGTTVTNKGTVNGTITQHSPTAPITLTPVAVCTPFSPASGISGAFTYNATRGDLTVSAGGTATLANGSYCFHSITLSTGSTLQVNGAVSITVTKSLNGKNGSIVNTTNVPSNLQISSSFNGTGGIALKGGNSAYLRVYAPSTDISIVGGGPIFGSLLGKTLKSANDSSIHVDVH